MTSRQPHNGFRRRNGTGPECVARGSDPASMTDNCGDVAGEALRVVDDWPAQVPIGADELDVLETFFDPLLDEILGGRHAPK